MKKYFDHSWRVIVASITLYITWIISMMISESIVPSGLEAPEGQETLSAALLFIVCFLHVIVLYIMVQNSTWYGIKMVLLVFFLIYMVQFFLSVVEAIWFNSSLNMPVSGHKFMLLSGFIMSAIFSPILILISGKMKIKEGFQVLKINWREIVSIEYLIKILFLIIFFYPILYNLAGYFIAWQFEAVRLFYTDSPNIDPFYQMFIANIKSGLYFFQIPRGLIWVLLALPVYYSTQGSYIKKGIIIGLLFATLMNAQHLLPNPYFPREVSFAHFIETFVSNFIWGYVIAWFLNWQPRRKLTMTS